MSHLNLIGISDLHGLLPNIDTNCDIVFICGDILPLKIQSNSKKSKKWLQNEFTEWAENLNCKKVVFIGGNHDQYLQRYSKEVKELFNGHIQYLQDDLIEFSTDNIVKWTIYGTPWCKIFGNWSFMLPPEDLKEKFDAIPNGLDVLLTHDQPYGYGDILMDDVPWNTYQSIGNKQLAEAVENKQPHLLLCGHLHSTTHNKVIIGGTDRYNVSLLNEKYEYTYSPLHIFLYKD